MFAKFLLLSGLLLGMASLAGKVSELAMEEARAGDREAIRAHIDKVFRAYMQKDRATIRATHAADWRGFIRGSRSVVRGIEQYMREAEAALSAPATLLSYEMPEFDVIFHGDTAVVSYIAQVEWEKEGVRFPDTLRVMDVYVKHDGEWNQAASHVASHPDALATQRQLPQMLTPSERRELLAEREHVWRAWFANDRAHLDKVIPEDTVAINAAEEQWVNRASILAGAKQFAENGGRLVRLEFPRTEIQVYGDVAIFYTSYVLETESGGQRQAQSGRATEVFVRRGGRWVNPGWHLDSGK